MRYVLRTALILSAACGGESLSPPHALPLVDGIWRASWQDGTGGSIVANVELAQNETSLSGVAHVAGVRHGIAGEVSSDSTLVIVFERDDTRLTFEGRVDTPNRFAGLLTGPGFGPVDAVFARQPDPSGPFLLAQGTWEASWTDADGSWSMTLALEQTSEELFVTDGLLRRTTHPVTDVVIEGGGDPVDGTVGTQGGVRLLLRFAGEPVVSFSFLGRFTSVTTVDGELRDFPVAGSSRNVTFRK